MIKLYRKFRPIDWVLVFFIMGLTVLQVYSSMCLTDFMSDLIKSIQCLYFKNTTDSSTWSILETTLKVSAGTISNASTKQIWWNGGMMALTAFGVMACQMSIAFMAAFVSSNFATTLRREINAKSSNGESFNFKNVLFSTCHCYLGYL